MDFFHKMLQRLFVRSGPRGSQSGQFLDPEEAEALLLSLHSKPGRAGELDRSAAENLDYLDCLR
jgi:hypothetical protein